jgi:Na+/melibiose symporter-like transporter
MAAEGIANFDLYAWIAAGLFIIGLFAIMIYEISGSKLKHSRQQQQQQQKRQEVGSSSDIKSD